MLYLLAITMLLTYIGYPIVKRILCKFNLVSVNYLGHKIILGYGLLLGINSIIILIVGQKLNLYSKEVTISFIFLTITVTMVGLLDDYFGSEGSRGFKGHFSKFLYQFQVTTGFLKAVIISVVSFLIINRLESNIILLIINFLLLVLMTNFINLLDLRPGRAIKGFLLLTSGIMLIANSLFRDLLLPLLLMAIILLPYDLREKAMLGDVGSNLLGAFLGLSLVINLGITYKLIIVTALIIVHIYAERVSLTKLIARNRILDYIDKLGRRKI
ncbi:MULTISPECIES: hypothetical protein [unclassified Candidatus Frackibacter]|uniref:hypothetical protein n=1 Tax=unclassified Candidatus Frackibacter TaxID=2648818 RepID=UPI000888385A|nr:MULTISPECIES: hypothetical protein [unclassified Candidatus Frackibacter]SDC02457.1 hypothetical protein SAMN04515661_101330 [Candidatus Frackibacter sp. WG11]SEM69814.1 hypothetical protein SAMN04488698_11280 [Candidatus Frackibacter sp. WG12]SFL81054.1 hypothetical protein SAMN04488699_11480 [Candidatus Frackibacter sp. WG13]